MSRKGPLEVRELLCELSEHLNRRITVAERKGYECSKVPVGELEEWFDLVLDAIEVVDAAVKAARDGR